MLGNPDVDSPTRTTMLLTLCHTWLSQRASEEKDAKWSGMPLIQSHAFVSRAQGTMSICNSPAPTYRLILPSLGVGNIFQKPQSASSAEFIDTWRCHACGGLAQSRPCKRHAVRPCHSCRSIESRLDTSHRHLGANNKPVRPSLDAALPCTGRMLHSLPSAATAVDIL